MEFDQSVGAYVCRFCKGSFDQAENLHKHVQQIHTARTLPKENRTCPLCGLLGLKYDVYRIHLRHIHGHHEEGQLITFKCFNDFQTWKNELEKRNYCKFVLRSAPKKLSTNEKIHVYQCDSSFQAAKEKKIAVASRDACPATISAMENLKSRGVKIEYWNTHVGHVVPIEDDELDAAIGSLETAEIVLSSDQPFQTDEQGESNIFYLESDGSLTEAFVKDVPKKSNAVFKTRKKSSEPAAKVVSQKFSFKKDPTKKSSSFNYSLASVACMKPSVKKSTAVSSSAAKETTDAINSIPSTSTTTETSSSDVLDTSTDIIIDTVTSLSSSQTTNAGSVNTLPPSATTTSVEFVLPSNTEIVTSPKRDGPTDGAKIAISPFKARKKVTKKSLCSDCTTSPIKPPVSQPVYGVISEGPMRGQIVLLNPTDQSVVVGDSGQKFFPVGQGIPIEQGQLKQASGTALKNTSGPQGIVLTNAENSISGKENVSSIQNVLSLPPSAIFPPGVGRTFLSSGSSILKKPESEAKSPKKTPAKVSSLRKTPSSSLPSAGKISLMSDASLSSSNVNQLVFGNVPLPPNIKGIVTTNSSRNAKEVPSANSSPVNQLLLNSLPPGQTYMSVNNNLIPIGAQGSPFLTSNLNPGYVITSSVPPMTGTKPAQSLLNLSQLIRGEGTSAVSSPVSSSNTVSSLANAPFILIPTSLNQVSSSLSLSTQSVASGPTVPINAKSKLATLLRQGSVQTGISSAGNSILTKPLMSTGVGSLIPASQLPPGARIISPQLLPNNAQFIPSSLLSATGNLVCGSVSAPSFVPVSTKSIVSTTVSNAMQVQKVHMPFTRNVTSTTNTTALKTSNLVGANRGSAFASKCDKFSSIIDVPSLPAAMQKPGTLILRSADGLYMLEPVNDIFPAKSGPPGKIISLKGNLDTPGKSVAIKENVDTLDKNVVKENFFDTSGKDVPDKVSFDISGQSVAVKESFDTSGKNVPEKDTLDTSDKSVAVKENLNTGKNVPEKDTSETSFKDIVEEDNFVPDSPQKDESPVKEHIVDKGNMAGADVVEEIEIDETPDNALIKSSHSKMEKPTLPQPSITEKINAILNVHETKMEGRWKSVSPRKNPEIKNGVQIKSVIQEKRPLKEDDMEILKKVKYYQLEMKYLSSQAECKRLRLELARAHMKNKETAIKETADISNLKDQSADGTEIIDETKSHPKLGKAADLDKAIDIPTRPSSDSYSKQVPGSTKLDEGQSKDDSDSDEDSPMDFNGADDSESVDNEMEEEAQVNDNKIIDVMDGESSILDEVKCTVNNILDEVICTDNNKLDEVICTDNNKFDKVMGANNNKFNELVNSNKSDGINAHENVSKEEQDFNKNSVVSNASSNDLIIKDVSDKTEQENNVEKSGQIIVEGEFDINPTEAVNNEINENQMFFNGLGGEGTISEKSFIEVIDESEPMDLNILNEDLVLNADSEEHIMDVDEEIAPGCSEPIQVQNYTASPCGEPNQPEDTLKELEKLYGKPDTLDIYTMIRTSVLQSLYVDMKVLCEKNKKLFEELHSHRTENQLYEIITKELIDK